MLLAINVSMATKRAGTGTTTKRSSKASAKAASKATARTSKRTARQPARASQKSSGKTATKRPASKAGSRGSTKSPPLAEYNAKRDFSKTKEPTGKVPKAKGKSLHFVIQKHAASHLHYDFRLELDGVMKSWAVPKGPSLDPSVRRLAMEVEDHPISYNTFEGTIPQGEYGGGTVMLWDRGTYEAEDGGGPESLRRGYEKGDLKIVLHGRRLEGGWVLVRLRRPGRPQWLLIKHRDEYATAKRDVTADETTSVVTRRTMEQIADGSRVWHSNR
jgi:DNA ligase D-like protein (predicted 3'-phosphoesterase)